MRQFIAVPQHQLRISVVLTLEEVTVLDIITYKFTS